MDFVTVLIGVVMFLSLIGMIICSKKQKVNPNAQPIAIVLMIVVIVCGIAMMYRTGVFGGAGTAELRQREFQYYASQGAVVGKFIAENYPGKKVLLLADQNFNGNERLQMLQDALKSSSKANVVVDTVTLANPPKAPEGSPPELMMDMPLFELMTAADFDNAIKKYSDCGVVVTTIGLPRDAAKMKLWTDSNRPALILLGGGVVPGLGSAIKAGKIDAAVIVSPDAKFTEDNPPSDPQEAFDMRYVLVTKGNADEFARFIP